jgi:hypothetical protein
LLLLFVDASLDDIVFQVEAEAGIVEVSEVAYWVWV